MDYNQLINRCSSTRYPQLRSATF